jgi:hypothetical protein
VLPKDGPSACANPIRPNGPLAIGRVEAWIKGRAWEPFRCAHRVACGRIVDPSDSSDVVDAVLRSEPSFRKPL